MTDREILTKADCRALGMSRGDVDRMFNVVPVVTLPDSRKTYVRREVLEEWITRHERAAPRPQRSAA